MKFDYADITRACKILGLDESATLQEINEKFRVLVKRFHPDANQENKEESEEKAKEVTWAYNQLLEFISSYRYEFSEEAVHKANFDPQTYNMLKKFYDQWWDKLDL